MSQLITATPDFEDCIRAAISEGLSRIGIDVDVDTERIPGVDLVRVFVTSPQFANLWGSERQELVWRALDRCISKDEEFLISSVFTMTPDEVEGK